MNSARPIILQALRRQPSTKTDAIPLTGLHRSTVIKRIEEMHQEGLLYIVRWKKHPSKGPFMAVYAVGSKPDAPCELPKLSKHEVYLRFKNRWEKSDKWDAKLARDRSRWWEKKASRAKQHPFSALGV